MMVNFFHSLYRASLDPGVFVHLLLWLVGYAVLFRIPSLSDKEGAPVTKGRLSVIIPARNESERLPILLASLRRQTCPPAEVIVVDDQSEDDTARIAERFGARVISSQALPAGWVGKTWACHQGSKAASGELFLFLDADVRLEPAGLQRILRAHEETRGVLSFQPYHDVKKAYEQLSAIFNLIQLAASSAFTIRGDAVVNKRCFGPTLLISRENYASSGGHEAVRDRVLENFFMSRRFVQNRIAIHCFSGQGAVSFRMYPKGVSELIQGWMKGFTAGAGGTSPLILIGVIAWLTGALGTARHLAVDLFNLSTGMVFVFLFLYLLYAFQIHGYLRRAGRFHGLTAFLYPLPMCFFVLVFIGSLVFRVTGRRFVWKGRKLSR
jgi:4,4'-diaponeurosporenoate glycosyltransferase